ncbi:hypothetical protein PV721_32560 [Streptomyces sp. MB09-01]|uniref:hypothetical protein n=1 Tax=Streptomyces sp. MB09-01 TaxID=3028666 RepID=UPI0029A5E532|nr:hypothetical protein [Streptomyces sp. MB09-01]MDX3538986.1 hypothetical protein [Streptomyces sp. MB09-01]
MGRFWDKRTGTRYPPHGVTPLDAQRLRDALLALGGPDARFVVREGTPRERADLVAECRISEMRLTLKTSMRLVPSKHEVRTLEERWEPSLERSGEQYGRGQGKAVYRQWEFQRGADGRRHKVETFRFETAEMKNPLQHTILRAGWTWRGVLFKL